MNLKLLTEQKQDLQHDSTIFVNLFPNIYSRIFRGTIHVGRLNLLINVQNIIFTSLLVDAGMSSEEF